MQEHWLDHLNNDEVLSQQHMSHVGTNNAILPTLLAEAAKSGGTKLDAG